MKKISNFLLLLLIFPIVAFSQEVSPVKNVIVMIPDGTSLSVYSAARWFKHYNGLGEGLNVDPYISGTVTTFSSNAPIGDSAPTGSTYASGVLQQTGNVSIHPEVSDNDIFPVDGNRTYQPAATILEASKLLKNKAVGLVVTCEFPHATPADFSAHYYNRGNYNAIAPQIAYQNLDVLFGGGNSILTDDIKQHFNNKGITLIQDDKDALLNYDGDGKVWALFGEKALPYNIDRNPDRVPSIAEMTTKALEILSEKENGFFLMVEGSQVDWAAHANDAATMINEYLAFDEAVGKVIEFAKKDGNTAVVILADHGNSGFSIGSRECPGYDKLSIQAFLFPLANLIKFSLPDLPTYNIFEWLSVVFIAVFFIINIIFSAKEYARDKVITLNLMQFMIYLIIILLLLQIVYWKETLFFMLLSVSMLSLICSYFYSRTTSKTHIYIAYSMILILLLFYLSHIFPDTFLIAQNLKTISTFQLFI